MHMRTSEELGHGLIRPIEAWVGRGRMRPAAAGFDLGERLDRLSRKAGDRGRLTTVVDVEPFRPVLRRGVARADRAKGGRPASDQVLMCAVA
jgi:hypothetical protein